MMYNCARRLAESLKAQGQRQIILQLVNLDQSVTSALMIWKTLIVCSGVNRPLSWYSVAPWSLHFIVGDILVLALENRATFNGEIVVVRH